MLRKSNESLEEWLAQSLQDKQANGVITTIKPISDGRAVEIWLPKEPTPFFEHVTLVYAGREPTIVQIIKNGTRERLCKVLFLQPSILHIYKNVDRKYFRPDNGEPQYRNITYVCATDAQIQSCRNALNLTRVG